MSARVKNCCGCVPLRRGLLIWGYFSLIVTYLSALVVLYRIQNVMYLPRLYDSNEFFYLFMTLIGILMNFIFNIVLVAGLYRKSCCMLEVYNGYLIISMVLEGLVSGLYIPLAMYRLYFADYNDSITPWTILFGAAILVIADQLSKYHILLCVRSLISSLGSKEEECQSEYTEVIVLDNLERRRKGFNLQPARNSDFTSMVHDHTNNMRNDDNLQPTGNTDANIHDDINNKEKDDNEQPSLRETDVTVHDHTKYYMEDDIEFTTRRKL